jgi:hypothetical protein
MEQKGKKSKRAYAHVNVYVYRDLDRSLFVVDKKRSGEDIKLVGKCLLRGLRRTAVNQLDTYIAKRTGGNRDHHFVTIKQLREIIRSFNEERC